MLSATYLDVLNSTRMSEITGNDYLTASVLDTLVRDITDWQLISYLIVASTALIFHDWFVTSSEELAFVWRRGRNLYVRVLFIGARYAGLACAILYWFLASPKLDNVITWLRIITIICSELIFITRTWAIWEKSRSILLFLIGLAIAVAAPGIAMAQISGSKALVTSRITLVVEGVGQYQILITAAKYPWIVFIPFLLILIFQSVILALTMYKLLQSRRDMTMKSRSTLVNVLWIDGMMYYVFMFILGVLNVGLTLKLSHRHLPLTLGQFQTNIHSILSTRVVLHTTSVLRQDVVDSEATLSQDQRSNTMRFAEVTIDIGAVPGDVELEEGGDSEVNI